MKKFMTFLFVLTTVFGVLAVANADSVNLYIDAAPNAYGSPNWDSWKLNAYDTAANGTFINMANSFNPANAGTTNFVLEDMVVYSFGDLGRRLHCVYWIPGETTTSLQGRYRQRLDYLWDGVWYEDMAWYTPSTWQDYTNSQNVSGVIGTFGEAWWGAYVVNTPEALAADLAAWRPYQGTMKFTAELTPLDESGPQTFVLEGHHVPIPPSLLLLGSGLAGLGLWRGRKFFSA